jgi:Ubiquitin-2 like Rad60 SUMO-like
MAGVAAMNDGGLWIPGSSTKEEKIEKWWEINRKHDPPLTRGATPLVERCMRVFGWGEAFSRRTLRGYRQFMELKSVMNDWQETKLSAPIAVQQMWEQHILDNLNYTDDCFLLFGRVIGHDPDCILNERATVDRIKTTKIAFQARYGSDLDPDVWDFGHSDADTIIDADGLPEHHQTSGTPRGMLPVAGVGAAVRNASLSPRARSLMVNSDDEGRSPLEIQTHGSMAADRGRGSSRPRSPPAQRSLSKGPRSPKSPTGNEPITIFLRDSNSGEETYFSLRYRSTLRIVFTVFAERKGLSQENLKFSFNSQVLTGYETPYSLGLEDRARIDVQVGPRRP